MKIKIIPENEAELEFAETSHVISSVIWDGKRRNYTFVFDQGYTNWLASLDKEDMTLQLANLSATLVNTFAANINKVSKYNSEQLMAAVLEKSPHAFATAPEPTLRSDFDP